MPKKVAYIMHVDWGWIKQRPHFLAEKLADYYELDLYFVRNYKDIIKVSNSNLNNADIPLHKIVKIPFSAKVKSFQLIEQMLNVTTLKKLYRISYDYIYFTSPIILQYVDIKKLNYKFIVYDCMDDHLSFSLNKDVNKVLFEQEQMLLENSNLVIASSKLLKRKILDRGYSKKVSIVNNAIDSGTFFNYSALKAKRSRSNTFNITYFGTVSHWFDFDILLSILNEHSDVVFTIIGPLEVKTPTHERLKYVPPIKHQELFKKVQCADAFIMPFIINELVLSVDPVKIYEYIALGKPTFTVKYNETLKFENYIYLYNNNKELSEYIYMVKSGRWNVDQAVIKEFVKENSWDTRSASLYKLMEWLENE